MTPEETLALNKQLLYNAASTYEFDGIGATAFSILPINSGNSKKKYKAVIDWIAAIWALYFNRLARLTTEPINPTFIDFSSVGACPYTASELYSESSLRPR